MQLNVLLIFRTYRERGYLGNNILVEHFPGGADGKESAYSMGDSGLIPGSWRCPGGGHSNPLQYSCLENSMDRGVWGARPWGCKELDMTEQLTLSFCKNIFICNNAFSCWVSEKEKKKPYGQLEYLQMAEVMNIWNKHNSIATTCESVRQDSWSPTNWSNFHMHTFFEFLKMLEVFQSLNHLIGIQKKKNTKVPLQNW